MDVVRGAVERARVGDDALNQLVQAVVGVGALEVALVADRLQPVGLVVRVGVAPVSSMRKI